MWLVFLAIIGLLAPNGLFLYWLVTDYSSLSAALSDKMAVAFFVDLVISTFLLSYLFARKPLGPVKWPWFLVLSLGGTLAFGIPLFIWLNWRRATAPRPSFAAWWRAV
ncbi:MAG TPA: hypothetical protein VGJ80_04170 [Gemmatimonadales bacterium]|jgi:hypothetical protein